MLENKNHFKFSRQIFFFLLLLLLFQFWRKLFFDRWDFLRNFQTLRTNLEKQQHFYAIFSSLILSFLPNL